MPEVSPAPAEANDRQTAREWSIDDAQRETTAALQAEATIRNIVIDFGTTALDVARKGSEFESDPYMGGLALVGRDNIVIGSGETFIQPLNLPDGHAGGLGNAANAAGEIVANEKQAAAAQAVEQLQEETQTRVWAIMAYVGDDDVGAVWKGKIHPEVDQNAMPPATSAETSGLSDIRVRPSDGDRAIYFRAGLSGATVPREEDLIEIAKRRPINFNISYPGLFAEGMDKDKGQTLSRFIRQVQKVCPMVSFDVHGFTELEHIEPALSHVDMWNANLGEAAKIFLGEKIEKPDDLPPEDKLELLRRIQEVVQEKYVSETTQRPRMFTITDKRGCFVMFQSTDGKLQSSYCDSPCAKIPAINKTGAGDVRFGLQRLYLAREMGEAWQNGTVNFADAVEAVRMGQIGATLQVQGKEAKAFSGVTLASIHKAAISGKNYETIADLRAELHAV
ncbi:MAG: hypothetical protein UY85_C0052G0004 [Candidatus Peribacteria bacterium GW2011_GWB1_54_5]|nr:MAG: hypothetical protein UY85_C0052G0004 [Candidatus Peribacteria bacterium GW2011_GWB1_54_5]